jgi:hypothetical protein
MNDLLVVVPTRERPANVVAFLDAWDATGTQADLIFAIDNDDPTLTELLNLILGRQAPHVLFVKGPRQSLAGWTNELAVANAHRYRAIGSMGDDHRPRTEGWDQQILDALDELGTGIVYGDDLIQHAALPTAPFYTADIVRTLGWFWPPGIEHLFVDNASKALGEAAGCLRYLPDVVIEHVHPIAGRAEWDESYRTSNSRDQWARDEEAYVRWRDRELPIHAAMICTLRRVA